MTKGGMLVCRPGDLQIIIAIKHIAAGVSRVSSGQWQVPPFSDFLVLWLPYLVLSWTFACLILTSVIM